ncbi:hypothetical protein CDAR_519931 [Caerostris darwini]|uniref:Uncharacterized protein n=1 Tax=Caerostris darwini TaxID=1538125 RepID=A0AAV4TFY8_9ARAC|nr:hypothetical protein CDAR_519931 [Caerostris darwini]
MPQGSHMKGGKANPKKPKITKPSKKGSCVTKRTPKKGVAEKKKLHKALERTIMMKVESELRAKAGGSGTVDKKPATAAKPKNTRKGKKK